jgi:hypothetical protein
MSLATIFNRPNGSIKKAVESNYANAVPTTDKHIAKIKDVKHDTKSVSNKNYNIATLIDNNISVDVKEFLPFRVMFTTIGIEGYNPNNPAPIGIAVVGYSNYIL